MQPPIRKDDRVDGESPEDAAILYSLSNSEGIGDRDFSLNRREYRAQMRHRAAEQLRLMELRAQSAAEAAADQADAEAAAVHAQGNATSGKMAASRTLPSCDPAPAEEEHVEHLRKSSLLEAAQQARRAAAERLEAARRAEAAALADSIARREEREIAEAQAADLRHAAQLAEAEMRGQQKRIPLPEGQVRVPKFAGEASGTGDPLRRDGQQTRGSHLNELWGKHLRSATGDSLAGHATADVHVGLEARNFTRPMFEEHQLSVERDVYRPDEANVIRLRRAERRPSGDAEAGPSARTVIPSISYEEFRRRSGGLARSTAPEVVTRLPGAATKEQSDGWLEAESMIGSGHSHAQETEGTPERWTSAVGLNMSNPFLRDDAVRSWRDPDPREGRELSDRFAEDPHGAATFVADHGGLTKEDETCNSWSAWDEPGDGSGFAKIADAQPCAPSRPPAAFGQEAERPQAPLPAEASGPAWLYAQSQAPHLVDSFADSGIHLLAESLQVGAIQLPTPPAQLVATPVQALGVATENTLQQAREQVASRWFALKSAFAKADREATYSEQAVRETKSHPPFLMVYSQGGGVGKTSLVATLGRALSSLGESVLLTETTSQGLLPFYFGATEIHHGTMRTFLPPNGISDAPVHLVSYDCAAPERDSAKSEGETHGQIFSDLLAYGQSASRILMDVNVNCGWMIGRMAWTKPMILVPLAADMNSVIGLQSIDRSFSGTKDAKGEPIRPVYLLNQFDASLPLHHDVREVLKQQLGDRLLPFVIRRATGVSEALAEGMTIVDYDPGSEIANDYMAVANWLRSTSAPAVVECRRARWSER